MTLQPPVLQKITVKRILDESPDLRDLGRYSETPDTKSKDEIVIDRVARNERLERFEYPYFIAANVENMEQALENYERMRQYIRGELCDFGVQAFASLKLRVQPGNYSMFQTLHSGGLWGLSSDDPEYIKQEAKNQIDELMDVLKAFGIALPQGGVEIKYMDKDTGEAW